MNLARLTLLAGLALAALAGPPRALAQTPVAQPGPAAAAHWAGLPREAMDGVWAEQSGTQWCWAACIQMILGHHGVRVPQAMVVERTFGRDAAGRLPDWAGTMFSITNNLNDWAVDASGKRYAVVAKVFPGPPVPTRLLDELGQGRPVLLAVRTSPTGGHAMVATAASWVPGPQGPIVQSVVVRDPWPTPQTRAARGRVEYAAADLAGKVDMHWLVQVRGR